MFCKRSFFLQFFFFQFIHTIYRHNNWFKITSPISLLIFISLSFNYLSLKSLKNLCLILKTLLLVICFPAYCLTTLFQYFHVYNFDVSNDSSLHVAKNMFKIFWRKFLNNKYYLQSNSSDFEWFQVIFSRDLQMIC